MLPAIFWLDGLVKQRSNVHGLGLFRIAAVAIKIVLVPVSHTADYFDKSIVRVYLLYLS